MPLKAAAPSGHEPPLSLTHEHPEDENEQILSAFCAWP